jgi:hypothetical protein
MDIKVLEALKGSIKKWEAIINDNGLDKMSFNCPLCIYSQSLKGIVCSGCIISEKTKLNHCMETPYQNWVIHQIAAHDAKIYTKIHCLNCREFAEDELAFLKSLLPKKE